MRLVELAIYDNSLKANLVKTKLESEGILCFVHNENYTNLFPDYSNLMGTGVKLLVPEDK